MPVAVADLEFVRFDSCLRDARRNFGNWKMFGPVFSPRRDEIGRVLSSGLDAIANCLKFAAASKISLI